MIIKTIPPGAWTIGDWSPKHIKIAKAGLRGYDLTSLIKIAGHELAQRVKLMDKLAGEEYIHLNAMGSTEGYNPNRNFDGWRRACSSEISQYFCKI